MHSFYSTHFQFGEMRGFGELLLRVDGSGVQGQSPWSGGLRVKPARSGGLRVVPPAGSKSRAPGQRVWGRRPQKPKAFCCASTRLLSDTKSSCKTNYKWDEHKIETH